ncbi:MAG: ATP-binding protein [Oscillospiraceae bacterium]|nr:ATP-binding protein [Oscillospiraceae bacterium]
MGSPYSSFYLFRQAIMWDGGTEDTLRRLLSGDGAPVPPMPFRIAVFRAELGWGVCELMDPTGGSGVGAVRFYSDGPLSEFAKDAAARLGAARHGERCVMRPTEALAGLAYGGADPGPIVYPIYAGEAPVGLIIEGRPEPGPSGEAEAEYFRFICDYVGLYLQHRGYGPEEVGYGDDAGGGIESLRETLDELKKAQMAKNEFLSRMSHEIRTPMNAIVGLTRIGMALDDVGKVKECLCKVGEASDHLMSILSDLLDMSSIESNRFSLVNEPFDMGSLVGRAIGESKAKAEAKGQSFNHDVDEDALGVYVGDETRVYQVLTSVLSNAFKFTPEGGSVSLTVGRVGVSGATCLIEAVVRDSGIGISAEAQGRLFEVFEQAEGGISRKYGGLGLSLSISKRIVGHMGGTIEVSSEEGKGSAFTITLPLHPHGPKGNDVLTKSGKSRNMGIGNDCVAPSVAQAMECGQAHTKDDEKGLETDYMSYLPYIDVEGALSRLKNNRKLYNTLLKSFLANNVYEDLKAAIAAEDMEKAIHASHTLKGVAANLSLNLVFETSASIESQLKSGADFKEVSNNNLEETLETTKKYISEIISASM